MIICSYSVVSTGSCRNKLVTRARHLLAADAYASYACEAASESPDPRSQQVARKYGIDISRQRARKVRPYDLESYDRVLAMDSANYRDLMSLALTEEERQKVQLIMNYAEPGMNRSVPDPYWDDDGFEQVYQMLDQACDALLDDLVG